MESVTRWKVAPSGRDEAGQPLGELRRMIDADGHRIRGEFIRVRERPLREQLSLRSTGWFRSMERKDLVAETLAMVSIRWSVLQRSRLRVPGRLLLMRAAIRERLPRVAREDEERNDRDEKTGAEKSQAAPPIRAGR